MVRFVRALSAVVVIGLVGGCTSEPDEDKPTFTQPSGAAAAAASPPAWSEPASYTYEMVRGCDAAAPLGRYEATVQGGVVTRAERVGAPVASPDASAEVDLGPITGAAGEEIEVPTLGQLVAMAETATEDGAEVATEFDTTDGHPVKVIINVTDTAAGAECWTVSAYQPGT